MNASISDKLAALFAPAVPAPRQVARVYFLGVSVLAAAGLPGLFHTGARSGQFIGSYSLQWSLLLGSTLLLALAQVAAAALLWTPVAKRLERATQVVCAALARLGWLNLAGFATVWLGYVAVVLWRYSRHFNTLNVRVWLFWTVVGVGALLLTAAPRRLHPLWALAATAVAYGAGMQVLAYLPQVSAYPFSLSWSEASRFYYSSLPYASQLYGANVPLSPWHPSRYLLLGLPYLLPGNSLWLHRLWQVLLWLGLSLATGGALMRRLRPLGQGAGGLGAVWAALFLLQGPVYYHLLICVILVLLGFDGRRFWQSLLVVALASAWAGISRVNWIPVPAMLALTLYLLEQPVRPTGSWLRYLLPPAAWTVVGGLVALAAQSAYVALSGQSDPSVFNSSFSSALLWYRLLPNPTYSMGVLPAILLLTAPALALVAIHARRNRGEWHGLRLLGLAGMALALLAEGLVVSTKIGGGSNIHNLDAYLVMMVILTAYLWMGRGRGESGVRLPAWRPWLLTALLVALPVSWNLNVGNPFPQRNFAQAAEDLAEIQVVMDQAPPGSEVLFITQRQLITFGYVQNVKLTSDYELLTLSEMAISHNQPYLDRFYADLRAHRFAVIVSSVQNTITKDPELAAFSEENNAWVEEISRPVLQYYQSRLTLDKQGVDILFPRPAEP